MTDIRIEGRANAVTGGDVLKRVSWSIPATGVEKLSVEECEQFATYLEENADEEWLSFILENEDPEKVAEELRQAVDEAEEKKVEVEERLEEIKEKHTDG